jgi:hypothetical protein
MQFGLSEFEQLTPREKNFLVLFVMLPLRIIHGLSITQPTIMTKWNSPTLMQDSTFIFMILW